MVRLNFEEIILRMNQEDDALRDQLCKYRDTVQVKDWEDSTVVTWIAVDKTITSEYYVFSALDIANDAFLTGRGNAEFICSGKHLNGMIGELW